MINVGAAHFQLDPALLDAMVKAGINDIYAQQLAQVGVFGGHPIPAWLSGLRAAANVMRGEAVKIDWGTVPQPWDTVGPAMASANGQGLDKALAKSVETWPDTIAEAIIIAVSSVARVITDEAEQLHHTNLANGPSTNRANVVQSLVQYLKPVDPDIARIILAVVAEKVPKDRKFKIAGEQLIEWLATHGKFVQVPSTGDRYYLWRDERKLFNLESDRWRAWLYLLSQMSPASEAMKYFLADCNTAAYEGEKSEVCRLAHWDGDFLRVSLFNGDVVRLDGETIEQEANGDGPALFADNQSWTSPLPDYSSDGSALSWWLGLLQFDGAEAEHRLALLAWLVGIFFTELCPTRPFLLVRGEAGSGKSMILRLLERLLFGPAGEVVGIPDKPDGFTAMAASAHLLVLDNLDEVSDWLRDKLARISTGTADQYRKLYTSNEAGTVIYRVWIAITARTPDTLRRDDLAERLLILPVLRIEDGSRERESAFLTAALNKRSQFWGDLLALVNKVVAIIRKEGLPLQSTMRMADFEVLGRVVARVTNQEDVWDRLITAWSGGQAKFLLEDSVIVEAIEIWLRKPINRGTWIETRQLYHECQLALFGSDRPDHSWPKSSKSFGRYLLGLRRNLGTSFKVDWRITTHRTEYWFDILR